MEQFEATDFERVDDIDDIEEADPSMRRLVAIMSQKTQLVLSDHTMVPGGVADKT